MVKSTRVTREQGSSALTGVSAREVIRQQSVASKAYELYLERGMLHGNDLEDWLRAEHQVAMESQIGAWTEEPEQPTHSSSPTDSKGTFG
jgi:hypothetical protein